MSKIARCFVLACSFAVAGFSLNAQAHKAANDPDLIELEHYTLTMDKVTRCMQALADIMKLAKDNPKMAAAFQHDDSKNETISDMTQRMSSYPQVPGIIQSHGFGVREFVVAQLTVFQSAFAAAAKKMGADPAKLASDAHVNPANITFMEQHEAEFAELQKKYPLSDEN